MGNGLRPDIIDDSPENRVEPLSEDTESEPRSLLSTIILTLVLVLCVVGFAYGLYKVLH